MIFCLGKNKGNNRTFSCLGDFFLHNVNLSSIKKATSLFNRRFKNKQLMKKKITTVETQR